MQDGRLASTRCRGPKKEEVSKRNELNKAVLQDGEIQPASRLVDTSTVPASTSSLPCLLVRRPTAWQLAAHSSPELASFPRSSHTLQRAGAKKCCFDGDGPLMGATDRTAGWALRFPHADPLKPTPTVAAPPWNAQHKSWCARWKGATKGREESQAVARNVQSFHSPPTKRTRLAFVALPC